MLTITAPVFAAKNEDPVSDYGEASNNNSKVTETTFFGNVEDDGEGCGVWLVINTGIMILTYGVGIAATVGLVITAILYITARDNAGQLAKAKTRFFEIIIGLAMYAIMWGVTSWLVPGGALNSGDICSTTSSSTTK